MIELIRYFQDVSVDEEGSEPLSFLVFRQRKSGVPDREFRVRVIEETIADLAREIIRSNPTHGATDYSEEDTGDLDEKEGPVPVTSPVISRAVNGGGTLTSVPYRALLDEDEDEDGIPSL